LKKVYLFYVLQKFDLERCDLKKLDDVEVKEKYQVEISNRFALLESLASQPIMAGL
jgi:hypothetical protein